MIRVMSDDLKKTGTPDQERINMRQSREVNGWSKTLGLSRDRLAEVVAEVGPMVDDVKKEIQKSELRTGVIKFDARTQRLG